VVIEVAPKVQVRIERSSVSQVVRAAKEKAGEEKSA